MDITAEPIATAMGKGRDDKREVGGEDSFATPIGCCLSTCHSCARSGAAGHSNTDVMTSAAWL